MSRVVIIGLDCLTPQLVFEAFARDLPTLSGLASAGMSAPLESSVPPITVPAWSVMVTGQDPGVLGCYGFRDRKDHSYSERRLASSLAIREPTLWQLLGRAGKRSRILSVPQTYPPKPLRGAMVTDCLTPTSDVPFTHPPELADEVQRVTGGYIFDVAEHRHQDRDALLEQVHEMTRRRFKLARSWVQENDWDFFMMVEMGPDRMHHAFWRYMAKDHPGHVPNHRFAHAIRDYYIALDAHVAELLTLLREDDVVLVVSDHGARTMRGGIALNQWLMEQGYLVLKTPAVGPTSFDALDVDWSKTRAWADGGYVGRVYANVRGREPSGVVAPDELPSLVSELRQGLASIRGPNGEALDTRCITPREAYRDVRGIAPELVVYFDDLAYRAVGSVGHPSLHLPNNDTGPDDANHARHGVFIMRDAKGHRAIPFAPTLYDIAPTVLSTLGVEIPPSMSGRVIR